MPTRRQKTRMIRPIAAALLALCAAGGAHAADDYCTSLERALMAGELTYTDEAITVRYANGKRTSRSWDGSTVTQRYAIRRQSLTKSDDPSWGPHEACTLTIIYQQGICAGEVISWFLEQIGDSFHANKDRLSGYSVWTASPTTEQRSSRYDECHADRQWTLVPN